MNNFLQNLYDEILNPPYLEDIEEEFIEQPDEVDMKWDYGVNILADIDIEEYIDLYFSHTSNLRSTLNRDIFKQLLDDILSNDYHYATSNLVSLSVFPRIKKYPSIKDFNFTIESNKKTYAEFLFRWLSFIHGHVFKLDKTFGNLKDDHFLFSLSKKHKNRIQIVQKLFLQAEKEYLNDQKEGIAYRLEYKHNRISIKGATTPIHKVQDGSYAEQLFTVLWKTPNKEINTKDINIPRPFNDLLKDMKFVNEYGKLFIPEKGKGHAILKPIITHKDLEEAQIPYLTPDELTKKMINK